jgi:hypothetical protein
MNTHRGELAHLRSIDGFGAAVCAIAAGEDFWIGSLHLIIYVDAAFFVHIDAANVGKERRHLCLSDSFNDLIASNFDFSAVGSFAAKSANVFVTDDLDRCCLPHKFDAVFASKLHLVIISRCVILSAAINHNDTLGSEAFCLCNCINSRVAGADDDNSFAERNAFPIASLYLFDKRQRVDDAFEFFAGNI